MSFSKLRKSIDYIAAFLGISAMVALILFEDKGDIIPVIKYVAGTVGLIYIIQFFYFWIFRRTRFDWYLVYGNYLMKVVCVVLLMPTIITMFLTLPSDLGTTFDIEDKDFVYQAELYHPNDTLSNEIRNEQKNPGLFWTIYYHYLDSGNQHMTTTTDARFIAAAVTLLGTFLLNGLLVSAVVGWVDRRKERWRKGEIRYSGLHLGSTPHYVIIGGHDSIYGVIRSIFNIDETENTGQCHKKKSKVPFLVIQTSRDVERFRRELFSWLSEEYHEKVVIYYGDRTSESDLAMLALEKAKEVYVLGEDARIDDQESYHDTMNMVCLKNISKYVKDIRKFYIDRDTQEDNRLPCRVVFEYQATFNIFQTTDVNHDRIKFLPLNYYEMWAQKVLIRQEMMERGKDGEWKPLKGFEALSRKNVDAYFPLEGYDGIRSNEDEFVHLVVVGMSRMGVALAIEAAHLAHYPNFETRGKRTRITFIDSSMKQERNFFMGRFKELFSLARQRYVPEMYKGVYSDNIRFPWFNPLSAECGNSEFATGYLGKDFIDIEWEFINGSIETPEVQQYLIDASANEHAKMTIAVCLPENSQSVAAAAYIDDKVYASESLLQVLVYQRLNDELINQINENVRYNRRLKAFGMANECFDLSLIDIAESVGQDVGVAYGKCSDNQISLMFERISNKGICDEILRELCPSFNTLDEEQQNHVKREWETWLRANCINNGGWKKSKKEKHKEIAEYLSGSTKQDAKGKSNSAKMWSTSYNVNSMWTKFRCVTTGDGAVFNPLEDGRGFSEPMLAELGLTEHNRWCTEQLLLRYRPLTEQEQKNAMMPYILSPEIEKETLKAGFAHMDICSNERLKEIDCNMPEFDVRLIEVLPAAYREYMKNRASR
ncbi:MAG: hypothetical protein IKJ97_00215 [Bacteroidaceae bacterium]|nr:hypothetical protein [Bacteroidaceae bacterium]